MIAHALDMGVNGIVVTQESERHHKWKGKSSYSVSHVECTNTYELLEALDFRLPIETFGPRDEGGPSERV